MIAQPERRSRQWVLCHSYSAASIGNREFTGQIGHRQKAITSGCQRTIRGANDKDWRRVIHYDQVRRTTGRRSISVDNVEGYDIGSQAE